MGSVNLSNKVTYISSENGRANFGDIRGIPGDISGPLECVVGGMAIYGSSSESEIQREIHRDSASKRDIVSFNFRQKQTER